MRFLSIFIVMVLHANIATAFSYFESKIDYWQPKVASDATKVEPGSDKQKDPKSTRPPSFDWKKHTDPKNDEFFREGEYIPPAPFMELVRNPTDANIQHWFEFIGKRNELSQRLTQRMQEYVAQNGPALNTEAKSIVRTKSAEVASTQPDYSRYRFRLYFHSGCPHCKRMMQSMTELQSRGYFVEIVQIDDNAQAARGLPFPVRPADPGELANKDIKSWPVLLVGDLQKKVVYRINGYQTTASILSSIRRS